MNTNHAFHPETVEALSTAFHKSWSFISNDPRFAMENPALLQRWLSACLMQLAAELLDAGAQGRLGHAAGLGSAAEMAMVGERH
jgi:hypothetical protein